MRIVADTNILVSAALKRQSIPAVALSRAADAGVLLKSVETERQLLGVLARPYLAALIAPEARSWIEQLIALAEPIAIDRRIVACRDPTDDQFLELAVNGRADILMTADKDLLVLHPFRGIPILAPAAFLQWLASS